MSLAAVGLAPLSELPEFSMRKPESLDTLMLAKSSHADDIYGDSAASHLEK